MESDLLIIGTGGTSRDIVEAVEAINAVRETWNVLGFLDDDTSLTGREVFGYPVLGTSASMADYPRARVVIGPATHRNLFVRRDIQCRLGLDRDRFATVIHPTAQISRRSQIGVGTVVLQFSFVSGNVTIGDHVIISQSVMIGHDATIGSYVTMSPALSISGSVRVGDGAFVGTGARLGPGIEVGSGALVGAGAIVFTSVAPNVTVSANPAKILPGGKPR